MKGGGGVNVRDKTCSKNRDTEKNKNQTSLGISLPLESGQLERWYFHLGASNGISVATYGLIEAILRDFLRIRLSQTEGRQRVVPTDESSSLRVEKTVPRGRESNLSRSSFNTEIPLLAPR